MLSGQVCRPSPPQIRIGSDCSHALSRRHLHRPLRHDLARSRALRPGARSRRALDALRRSGGRRVRCRRARAGAAVLGSALFFRLHRRRRRRRGRGLGRCRATVHVPLGAQDLPLGALRHLLGPRGDRAQQDAGRPRNRRRAGSAARDREAGPHPRPAQGAIGRLPSGGLRRTDGFKAARERGARALLRLQQLGLQHPGNDPEDGGRGRRLRGLRRALRATARDAGLSRHGRLLPLRARQVEVSGLPVPDVGPRRRALRAALRARASGTASGSSRGTGSSAARRSTRSTAT